MITFEVVTFFMFIPSTILTTFLIYIVLKKSPPAMTHYKYVVIFTGVSISHQPKTHFQLSVFQFDIVDSLLLCPITIKNATGFNFVGFLGAIFPTAGNILVVSSYNRCSTFQGIYIISIAFTGLTLVANFIWREYSLIKFEPKPLYVLLHLVYFIICLGLLVYLFPMFNEILISDQAMRLFLDSVSSIFFSLVYEQK